MYSQHRRDYRLSWICTGQGDLELSWDHYGNSEHFGDHCDEYDCDDDCDDHDSIDDNDYDHDYDYIDDNDDDIDDLTCLLEAEDQQWQRKGAQRRGRQTLIIQNNMFIFKFFIFTNHSTS